MALSPRRAKFAQEYAIDGNGQRAARAAGYAEKNAKVTASRLLTDDNVLREVDRHQRKAVIRHTLTREKVIAGLQVWAENDNPAAAVKAWELLGKELGMFADRHVIVNGLRELLEAVERATDADTYDRVLAELAKTESARGLLPERAA